MRIHKNRNKKQTISSSVFVTTKTTDGDRNIRHLFGPPWGYFHSSMEEDFDYSPYHAKKGNKKQHDDSQITMTLIVTCFQQTEDKLGKKGLTSLGEALKTNTTLTKLNIDGGHKSLKLHINVRSLNVFH